MDKAQASNTAIWDALANEMFIDICVEEVVDKDRPLQCLNNKGYRSLMTKFKERINRKYSRKQLKNHWDSLKRDYSNWKTLKLHASGLGIDPKTGSIKASDEWWAEQIKAMPHCSKFKKAPLQHEDSLDIIFDGASCTNESALVPGAEGAAYVNLEDDEGEGDEPAGEDETTAWKESPHVDKGKKTARPKRAAHDSPGGKKPKKPFKDVQLKRLVDIVERSHGSKNSVNNAPGQVVDPVRQEISDMLDLVIEAGAREGSDEHFYATQLLIKKEYRDVFHTLKTPQGRLAWLTRTWEEKKRH